MTVKVFCLVATLALAGCVTETTQVTTAPLTAAEAEVSKVVLAAATEIGIASVIAEDCPQLGYNMREEDRQIEAAVQKSIVLLDGDVDRAVELIEVLERQSDAQLFPQIEPRILAYIKANDYLPGSATGACRVGNEERRKGTAIGRLLTVQ
jgi:hypothetical protein